MEPYLEELLKTRLVKGIDAMRWPENPSSRWINYRPGYDKYIREIWRGLVEGHFAHEGNR